MKKYLMTESTKDEIYTEIEQLKLVLDDPDSDNGDGETVRVCLSIVNRLLAKLEK